MLGKLARQHDPNVLVGFDHADDAGVYQIAPDGKTLHVLFENKEAGTTTTVNFHKQP